MTSIREVSADEFVDGAVRGDQFVDGVKTSDPKRILFNVGHPAQVHLFRNAIADLEAMGHETLVASRHKEVTIDLLDAYGIEHVPMTRQASSFPGLIWEMIVNEKRLYGLAREFQPDVIVSRLAPPPVHVSKLVGCKNLIVSDTLPSSPTMRRLIHGMTLPFVDLICMPASFDLDVAPDRTRVMEVQELAYLHPDRFAPNPDVCREHGIEPTDQFFVLRLAGWEAYHDAGHAGISPDGVRELVDFLSEYGDVYVSAEGELPGDLDVTPLPTPPEVVHHVLYYADLYVGDSGTMSVEAAVLGTPAIRTNTLVGDDDLTVFDDLETEYGLLRSFTDESDAIAAVKALVCDPPDPEALARRRQRLVDDVGDTTQAMVDTILEVVEAPQPAVSNRRKTDAHSKGEAVRDGPGCITISDAVAEDNDV